MHLTRRTVLAGPLAAAALAATGCERAAAPGVTRVFVMGTIHRRHRTSKTYSLPIIEAAMREAAPDLVLMELPPQSLLDAWASYRETGKVDERRTNVFPEYTDVAIPLANELGWDTKGVAAWTPEIGANRRKALEAIEADKARAEQWAETEEARRTFILNLDGRSDDPRFIHTDEFDALVKAWREPYARYFDADLGPGGWTQINDAHGALINAALDEVTGKGLRVLITFGTSHKYKIRESLAKRSDVQLEETRALFE